MPDQYGEVSRPDRVKIRYINENNETVDREVSGLLATCIQHELDHLQGILFIDYLSNLKRNIIFTTPEKVEENYRNTLTK